MLNAVCNLYAGACAENLPWEHWKKCIWEEKCLLYYQGFLLRRVAALKNKLTHMYSKVVTRSKTAPLAHCNDLSKNTVCTNNSGRKSEGNWAQLYRRGGSIPLNL